MSAGNKLKELRGEKNKQTVADAIGVTLSSYVKYERDERVPRDEVKIRIAHYFGTTVGNIFFANDVHNS
jgi:DNA-binding XRE family transcriptional regulator